MRCGKCGWFGEALPPGLPRKAGPGKGDFELAAEVKRIILSDLEIFDSASGLARKAGTNSFTLKKVFREQYGISVFKFSQQARIEYAKQFLVETDYTLQTIAEMIGYTEGNNFQVAFKRVVGCTPGEFRRDFNE